MVVLDCGGADRPISEELLSRIDYVSPNETELARLTGALPLLLMAARYGLAARVHCANPMRIRIVGINMEITSS